MQFTLICLKCVRACDYADPEFYANILREILEVKFTQERLNKIQTYLNNIGQFKKEPNEDFKILIDRFNKLMNDVRRLIDPKQVPTK
jgi:hypothetical protein